MGPRTLIKTIGSRWWTFRNWYNTNVHFLVPFLALAVASYVGWNQMAISRKQVKISAAQVNISQKQADLAALQKVPWISVNPQLPKSAGTRMAIGVFLKNESSMPAVNVRGMAEFGAHDSIITDKTPHWALMPNEQKSLNFFYGSDFEKEYANFASGNAPMKITIWYESLAQDHYKITKTFILKDGDYYFLDSTVEGPGINP